MEIYKSGLILCLLMNIHIMVLVGAITYNYTSSNGVIHNYGDALTKCILFFEGQRSGKLPSSQRMKWRRDSGIHDGSDVGVDLVGGYYDAGDNVKFNFPMAFSTTMLAWGVLEFGNLMGPDLQHAIDAVRWGTDYFLKATSRPGVVYAGVGDPTKDHNCWERPEDMDTLRTAYAVTPNKPGSEVSGEIAAALAAASLVFRTRDPGYSKLLLQRATMVFQFADKYRGNYGKSLGPAVCPFYCGTNGYQDELIWAATWLYKATKANNYWNYVKRDTTILGYNSFEFGWDAKYAGINILASKLATSDANLFVPNANKFVCSLLPESPTKSVIYTPGGLLFSNVGSNLQTTASISFLMVVYGLHLFHSKTSISCGNVAINPGRLIHYAESQVDYILGTNPMKMSYMVGYGNKFPQMIHHRGSSLPSVASHPKRMACRDGGPFFDSKKPNPNLLIGAVVGGPDVNDRYADSRYMFNESEPTTYINAPLVGTLAYFKAHSKREMPSKPPLFNLNNMVQ